jgi:hypothetical protein
MARSKDRGFMEVFEASQFVEAIWRLDVIIKGHTKVIESHQVLMDSSSLITAPCYTVITSDGKNRSIRW